MFRRSKEELAVGSWQLAGVRLLTIVAVFAGIGFVGLANAAQEARRNVEAQKLKNPEPSNADTLEVGKKLYARHCASCHGPNAKGDGGMALSGGTPSDLTDEAWDYGSTDGEIFVAIKEGVSADMLAYKEKLNDQQIWQVVSFLRSVGPKPKAEK
jgi:cbb3-type cytochrome c oxidase subunit III